LFFFFCLLPSTSTSCGPPPCVVFSPNTTSARFTGFYSDIFPPPPHLGFSPRDVEPKVAVAFVLSVKHLFPDCAFPIGTRLFMFFFLSRSPPLGNPSMVNPPFPLDVLHLLLGIHEHPFILLPPYQWCFFTRPCVFSRGRQTPHPLQRHTLYPPNVQQ